MANLIYNISMNAHSNRIFHPIPKSQERDSILAFAALSGAEVYIKFSDSRTMLVKALKWIPPFKLQVTYPEGIRPLVQKPISIQFSSREDRYFAQVFTQDTGTQFFLIFEGPIFRVQRRQSYRLRIPASYPAVVEVFQLNGHRISEKATLDDISEGGCSLFVGASLVQAMGSHLGISLKIGSRPPMILYGSILYLKNSKSQVRLGIRFDKTGLATSELFNLNRELYVELFSRWSKRR